MTDETALPQTEATEVPEATEAATDQPAVVRQKQNGFTRPIEGTKTGMVWDIADEISAKEGRPALRAEVIEAYTKRVPDARTGTISTQYSRWCGFHNVQDILKKMRADEKAAAKKIKDEEKAAKAAAAAEKKKKAAEKAAKAAAEKKKKAAEKADKENAA